MKGLTNKDYWLNYWETKSNIIFRIPSDYPFISLLKELIESHNVNSLLEIGGFPGYYSVWAKKNMAIKTTLLDFVLHKQLMRQLAIVNGIGCDEIETLEVDLLTFIPDKKFDLVMSNGLIEHFENTIDIIKKHVAFLSDKGVLFISIPNFRGLNGWFQKKFDRVNYDKHFIECMHLKYLEDICLQLGLKDIQVYYSGRFMLWLEDEYKQPLWVRLFRLLLWCILKLTCKLIPFESRALSPFIVITAHI